MAEHIFLWHLPMDGILVDARPTSLPRPKFFPKFPIDEFRQILILNSIATEAQAATVGYRIDWKQGILPRWPGGVFTPAKGTAIGDIFYDIQDASEDLIPTKTGPADFLL